MEKLKSKMVCCTIGVASGLGGIASLAQCSGNTCTSCFRCAGAGIGIILITLWHKGFMTRREKKSHAPRE